MSKLVADQADGLRRLLARTPTRIVAVAGSARGAGATTTAMNLGAALVQQGKDVLLLDEQEAGPDSACAIWNIDPFLSRASRSACGVDVLPAPPGGGGCAADLRSLCPGGVILIDAAFDAEGRLSLLAQAADEVVLVLQPDPTAITTAYACIKRLHYAHALQQLRFIVNGAEGEASARQITTNLANTGSRYLGVSLESAGWVRADPHLAGATRLGQTVVEAFPASAAAVDFRLIAVGMGRWPWRAPAQPAAAVGTPPRRTSLSNLHSHYGREIHGSPATAA